MGRGGAGSRSHGLGVSGGLSLGQLGVRPPSPQGTSARCVVLQGCGVSVRCWGRGPQPWVGWDGQVGVLSADSEKQGCEGWRGGGSCTSGAGGVGTGVWEWQGAMQMRASV